MATKTFTAVIHLEEDIYVAECPQVEQVSQGETIQSALANLTEATELYLEEWTLPKNNLPITTTFEVNFA